MALDHVACLSVEPWDTVRRRNQHLAARLVRNGMVRRLTFVNPPVPGLSLRSRRHSPQPGIDVLTPPLVVPRRWGGHAPLGWWTRRLIHGAQVVWVNDAIAGAHALDRRTPAIYDVTDDWREFEHGTRDRARIIAAEDRLASRAQTIVCSSELAARWRERYGVAATVVQNGVDLKAIRSATPRRLPANGPVAVYVGTLHRDRLDIDLLCSLARSGSVGAIHLVGPNHLSPHDRQELTDAGTRLEGPCPSEDVPGWLVAADVLICPHVVTPFTLSLDAIKSHEYLATNRPIVATPSSGFQDLAAPSLYVADASTFVGAVESALKAGPASRDVAVDWDDRAVQFGSVLLAAVGER